MPTYIRLTDYKSSDEKEKGFFDPKNRYEAKQEDFKKIPGSPIAYWVSDRIKEIFESSKKLGEIAEPRQGLATGNNDLFMRIWSEVPFNEIGFNIKNRNEAFKSKLKWFPYNKGGEFQKWYGNQEYLVNWNCDGVEIQNFFDKNGKLRSRPQNKDYYFLKSISWTLLSSSYFAVRAFPYGFIFDVNGMSLFIDDKGYNYLVSFLSSKLSFYFLRIINPTLAFQVGNIKALPIIFPKDDSIKQKIDQLTQQNIDISKEEWDSREISWDFRTNELIRMKNEILQKETCKIEDAYNAYCEYWEEKFFTLHKNEEELNRLFIGIYELEDELTPDVALEDITILKNEAKIVDGKLVFQADEIMKQFISYGVGVMFGRYSLDHKGLHVANMSESLSDANAKFDIAVPTFEADDDNIIPVLEDDYFKDDIASRFVQFVKSAFGQEHLSENVKFIEDALGKSLRKYFVKDFYEDHIKRYKKRPIYWMVSSPKKSFMSLIYMHRYETDTFARVRNSYLLEYVTKLEAHKDALSLTVNSQSASDRDKKAAKQEIQKCDVKLKELIEFDRDAMMSVAQNPVEIDLDDGVKVNYCKFKEILYPIKGLCK